MLPQLFLTLAVLGCAGFLWTTSKSSTTVDDQITLLNSRVNTLNEKFKDLDAQGTRRQSELNGHYKSIQALGNAVQAHAKTLSQAKPQATAKDIDDLQDHIAFMREKLLLLESKSQAPAFPSGPIPVEIVRDPQTRIRTRSIYKRVKRQGKHYWIKDTEVKRIKKKSLPNIRGVKKAMADAGL